MHVLIYALVRASDEHDAIGVAQSEVFDHLVGATRNAEDVFDYYETFDTSAEASSPTSGAGRWGNRPQAARVDSHAGARMLWRGWKYTLGEKTDKLDKIREELSSTSNEDILEGLTNDSSLRLYDFRTVGELSGPSVRLYDGTTYTFGVTCETDVNQILEQLDDEDERPLWVVPADVHY